MKLGDFFPNFEKNPNLQKNFSLKIGIYIQSPHTQATIFYSTIWSYFSFNFFDGKSIYMFNS